MLSRDHADLPQTNLGKHEQRALSESQVDENKKGGSRVKEMNGLRIFFGSERKAQWRFAYKNVRRTIGFEIRAISGEKGGGTYGIPGEKGKGYDGTPAKRGKFREVKFLLKGGNR